MALGLMAAWDSGAAVYAQNVDDEVTVNDPVLRRILLRAVGKQVTDPLTRADVGSITRLNISHTSITNLDLSTLGLTSLTELNIEDNDSLPSLDLSDLTSLTRLSIRNNDALTSLDLSDLTSLTELNIDFNDSLTSLDLSDLTSLTELTMVNNSLTSLDLSDLTSLTELTMWGNDSLTSLDLSDLTSLTELTIWRNDSLTSLDLSDLTSLTELNIRRNDSLPSLDLSDLTSLTELNIGDNDSLPSLDLSDLTSLTKLNIWDNDSLPSLALSDLTSLTELTIRDNDSLTSLALSDLTSLTKLTMVNNSLTSLDLSDLTSLTELNIWDNDSLTSLDLSDLTSLTELNIWDNDSLTSLDLSDLTSLTELNIWDNDSLTSLDLSDLTSLTKLTMVNNSLTSLALSDLTSLTELTIRDNDSLTSLRFSGLCNLKYLGIIGNASLPNHDFSSLVNCVSGLHLHLQRNPSMTRVKLAGVSGLGTLEIHDNATLESIDLSDLFVPGSDGGSGRSGGRLRLISCININLRSMSTPPGDSIGEWDEYGNDNLEEITASPQTRERFPDEFDRYEEEGIDVEEDNRMPMPPDDWEPPDDLENEGEEPEGGDTEGGDTEGGDTEGGDTEGEELAQEALENLAQKALEKLAQEALEAKSKRAQSKIAKKLLKGLSRGIPYIGPAITIIDAITTMNEIIQTSDAGPTSGEEQFNNFAEALYVHHEALQNGSISWDQALLSGRHFTSPVSLSQDTSPDQDTSASPRFNALFKGTVDFSRFDDRTDDFNFDGSSTTYRLGLDVLPNPDVPLVTGLQLAFTTAHADFEDTEDFQDTVADAQGTYGLQMLSAHPFVMWNATEDLSLWASLGYGRGEIDVTIDSTADSRFDSIEGSTTTSNGNLFSVAAGAHFQVWQSAASALAIHLDGSTASFLDANTQEGRLAAQLSRDFTLNTGRLRSAADLALLLSNTDTSAVELSGSLNWLPDGGRLGGTTRARVLLLGEDRSEWGVSGSLFLRPGQEGEGLSVSLNPSFGKATASLTGLDGRETWERYNDLTELALGATPLTARFHAQVAYGFRHGNALLTPYTKLNMSDHSTVYGAGLRYALDTSLDLDLSASHRNRSSGTNDNRFFLQLRSDL